MRREGMLNVQLQNVWALHREGSQVSELQSGCACLVRSRKCLCLATRGNLATWSRLDNVQLLL